MIIQVRGTSGSGKSTVIRRVMAKASWEPEYVKSRRQPLYYRCPSLPLVVMGHYESPCGGCDTIGSARQVYEVTQRLLEGKQYQVIIQEGLLLSEDTKWSIRLPELSVLFLITPLETCLTRIEGRRKAAGNTKPLDPYNTANRVAVIERARLRLSEAGVLCRRVSADQAPEIILKWLKNIQQ